MTGQTYAARPDLGQHLATVASVLRDIAGGAHWDVPGIRAEVHKAKHLAPPDQLAHAVITWATSRLDLRAPIGLAEDGPWWSAEDTPDARVVPAKCTVIGHESYLARNCGACRAEQIGREPDPTAPLATPDPAQAEVSTRGADLARAAIAAARGQEKS